MSGGRTRNGGLARRALRANAAPQRASYQQASENDRRRMQELETTLDQCWDLLHQRRARRSAGMDPDDAAVRDAATVEGYVD